MSDFEQILNEFEGEQRRLAHEKKLRDEKAAKEREKAEHEQTLANRHLKTPAIAEALVKPRN